MRLAGSDAEFHQFKVKYCVESEQKWYAKQIAFIFIKLLSLTLKHVSKVLNVASYENLEVWAKKLFMSS